MKTKLLSALLASFTLSACAAQQHHVATLQPQAGPVSVQILAVNDFHGNLETPQRAETFLVDGEQRSARLGGAAELAATLAALRTDNSVTVAAGDLIGASPLISSLFLDEPSVQALSDMGLDIASVGNHEFDRGTEELQRIQSGGCEQFTRRTPCALEPFAGADFDYLAGNVVDTAGESLFPGTEIREIGGVQVGFIGLTLKTTPNLVAEQATAGYAFLDEAQTANALAAQLRSQGADAIVLLIHEGATVEPRFNSTGCPQLSGDVVPIVEALSSDIALVVSGHTHQAYICTVTRDDGSEVLLTSGGRYGGFVTDIAMEVDPATDRVLSLAARNIPVDGSMGRDSEVAAYVARYAEAAGPVANRPVADIADTGVLGEDCGDRPADGLIADAYFHMAQSTLPQPADFAVVNSGGVRTDLSGAADGVLSYGELAAMAPFGNTVLVLDMTGAQVRTVLEQQLCEESGSVAVCDSILVPSAQLQYSVDLDAPAEGRIGTILLNGEPIEPEARYRVATNNFLSGGGDGFAMFAAVPVLANAGFDIDGLETYVAQGNLSIPVCGRVRGIAPVD